MRGIHALTALVLIAATLACSVQVNLTDTPEPSAVQPPQSAAPPAGDLGIGKISGVILDAASGLPVPGAVVECTHVSYTVPEEARCNRVTATQENGGFVFQQIQFHDTDQISLTVTAEGYDIQTIQQTGFTAPDLTVSIQLNYQVIEESLAAPHSETMIDGCPIFPSDNFWNTPIDSLPVHKLSDAWIDHIGRDTGFHMDFGSGTWDGGPIGIPFNLIDGSSTVKYPLEFYYPDESDPGPYPIPSDPLIEYGSDHHILTIDRETCTLYEIYDASYDGTAWSGGSGAVWDLNSNALRPEVWTSADAAGLPILPGLARYDEIESGRISHALRFTIEDTAGYIWPARHQTADPQQGIPPMGARFRLKAGYDISSFPPELQVLLQAMKTYGIVLADNGSNWYVGGAPDERWDNDMLHLLDVLTGNDFEAVDSSLMMIDLNSGQAK